MSDTSATNGPGATRTVTLADFLEPYEIAACTVLYQHVQHCPTCSKHPSAFVETVEEQLITPRIERINKQLGQENDPKYLAYIVEYAMIAETRPARTQQPDARVN